jgi:small subunit ribosomal protein S15
MITAERKKEIFAEYGKNEKNTGAVESQIALFTEHINALTEHLKVHKKDFSTRRALLTIVGQRKRLLTYMSKHDLMGYRKLIEKLKLRK